MLFRHSSPMDGKLVTAAVISRESSALQSTTCMALQTRNQKQNQQRSLGLVRPFKTNRVENNKRKGKSFFT